MAVVVGTTGSLRNYRICQPFYDSMIALPYEDLLCFVAIFPLPTICLNLLDSFFLFPEDWFIIHSTSPKAREKAVKEYLFEDHNDNGKSHTQRRLSGGLVSQTSLVSQTPVLSLAFWFPSQMQLSTMC